MESPVTRQPGEPFEDRIRTKFRVLKASGASRRLFYVVSQQRSLKTQQRVKRRDLSPEVPAGSAGVSPGARGNSVTPCRKSRARLQCGSGGIRQGDDFELKLIQQISLQRAYSPRKQIFTESLILAQDERWRRASYMQVERGPSGLPEKT